MASGLANPALLRLAVDHVDGDYHNNLASNLRYLCPNCHSQTESFAGRSRGRYAQIDPEDHRAADAT